MTKPLIALISAPRSGTNQVMTVLRETLGIETLGEWFDPEGAPHLRKPLCATLSRHFGRPVRQEYDAELGRWTHADPGRSLTLLRDTLPHDAPAGVFKLFPYHLSQQKLKADMLPFPDTLFLVLERDPIDVFISHTKAKKIDRWLCHDTTGQRIDLDAEAYIAYRDLRTSWFDFIRTELTRQHLPWADLRYEEDVLPGAGHLDARLREELRRMGLTLRPSLRARLRLAHGPRLDAMAQRLGIRTQQRTIGLPRQDRAPRRRDKVSNWDAFSDEIAALTGTRPKG